MPYYGGMDEILLRAAQWDPGLLSRVSGAPPDAIDALQEQVGRPLPPVYRDFLALMGQSTGGLIDQGDFNIRTVADFYGRLALDRDRDRNRSQLQQLRCARYLFIGTTIDGDGVYPDFHLDAQGVRRDCVFESETVLRPEYEFLEEGFVTAGSLGELFLGQAFYYLRLGRLPFRRALVSVGSHVQPQSRPAAFNESEISRQLGFLAVTKAPLVWHAYDHPDAAVTCYQQVGLGLVWTVAARTRALAEKLITAMCEELRLLRSVKTAFDTLP
jgi:hypothetical protein